MEKAKIYQIIQDKKEDYFVNIALVTISVRKPLFLPFRSPHYLFILYSWLQM